MQSVLKLQFEAIVEFVHFMNIVILLLDNNLLTMRNTYGILAKLPFTSKLANFFKFVNK